MRLVCRELYKRRIFIWIYNRAKEDPGWWLLSLYITEKPASVRLVCPSKG